MSRRTKETPRIKLFDSNGNEKIVEPSFISLKTDLENIKKKPVTLPDINPKTQKPAKKPKEHEKDALLLPSFPEKGQITGTTPEFLMLAAWKGFKS